METPQEYTEKEWQELFARVLAKLEKNKDADECYCARYEQEVGK